MASSGTINISQLADTIAKTLDEFSKVTSDIMSEAVEETADEVAELVRSKAPRRKNGGAYAGSITSGQSNKKRDMHSKLVYAAAPHYRLTHLVENGHASRNGGRVAPSPKGGHWAPAEAEASVIFVRKIKEKM